MKREDFAGQKILVLGAARSGIAAAQLLKLRGLDVLLADSRTEAEAGPLVNAICEDGIMAVWGDKANADFLRHCDVLVKSPGIPNDNPLVEMARENGARIISEIELAAAFLPAATRVIAVTGTNGKTTTTAWLAHVLNGCGYNAITAGNIGDAWAARLLTPPQDPEKTVYVVEVSSFQLENVEDFHPDVAVLTNITPDHMDRYNDDMELYVAAKANLLKNLSGGDVFVWNAADPASAPVAAQSRAENRAFHADIADGDAGEARLFVKEGQILWRENAESGSSAATPLMPGAEVPLPGYHNLENALAVLLAAISIGADPSEAVAALKTFTGVEHRIEPCGIRKDGVPFYNDSKATNLDAMEKAVASFAQPMVLIAGGRDAHSDYASISPLIQRHVMKLITLGEAAPLIEDAWGSLVPTQRAGSMAEAVQLASAAAPAGSVIVFSPACKSFDMYENFEERGRDFKARVHELLANTGI